MTTTEIPLLAYMSLAAHGTARDLCHHNILDPHRREVTDDESEELCYKAFMAGVDWLAQRLAAMPSARLRAELTELLKTEN